MMHFTHQIQTIKSSSEYRVASRTGVLVA